MSISEPATAHALTLAEAVPLLHGVVDRLATELDARILFIKGPILAQQGLRDGHESVDVDVWVEPASYGPLQRGLECLGWAVRVPSTGAHILPMHSTTYAHPMWPCEIDVHDRFPGFLADPQTTFEVMWSHRTTATVAGRELPCCDPVAHAAVAALHYLRDPGYARNRELLDALVVRVDERFDGRQRAQLAGLAEQTGAVGTLGPALHALGIETAPTASHPEDRAWRLRTSATGVKSVGWLVELRRTPLRRLPRTLLHAALLTEAEIRAHQPNAAPGGWGLFRARLRRLGWGLRDLPRACRLVRRSYRAERTAR
jgi:Uncharacterised nucleotidyltransferase